jgi:hypothetical protein
VTDAVDVFDILEPVLARDGSEVHLAPLDWPDTLDTETLCGRPVSSSSPTTSFLTSGCPGCARRAVAAGIGGVRESQQVVVNLTRFLAEAGSPDEA